MRNLDINLITGPLLTDSGLETTLIYHHLIDLPHFAAFPLLEDERTRGILEDYYRKHLEIAEENHTGFILESATWRANPDWGYQLGYKPADLRRINRLAISELIRLREEYKNRINPVLVSGCVGPRADAYSPEIIMSAEEASVYHFPQLAAYREAGADLATALTMSYADEAKGIVLAAKSADLPVVISFTVETDGRLPDGTSLRDAIETIDGSTGSYPLYYMINCAHPGHFTSVLEEEGTWKERIMGLRANASCKSHQELDESTELEPGDKHDLAGWYLKVERQLPHLKVYGGCCGTDHGHIHEICRQLAS